jgi:hypothetical protein
MIGDVVNVLLVDGDEVDAEAILEGLVSEDHFSVDGTLIESYASIKSLRPIDQQDQKVSDGSDDDDPGNPTVDFRGEKRVSHSGATRTEFSGGTGLSLRWPGFTKHFTVRPVGTCPTPRPPSERLVADCARARYPRRTGPSESGE